MATAEVTELSIRDLEVPGTLENASKPALATRKHHDNSRTSSTSMNTATINDTDSNGYDGNDKYKTNDFATTDETSPWQFLTAADACHFHRTSWKNRELIAFNTPWFIDDAEYMADMLEMSEKILSER